MQKLRNWVINWGKLPLLNENENGKQTKKIPHEIKSILLILLYDVVTLFMSLAFGELKNYKKLCC